MQGVTLGTRLELEVIRNSGVRISHVNPLERGEMVVHYPGCQPILPGKSNDCSPFTFGWIHAYSLVQV
ncbi:hypothetical protein GCM10007061_10310 [Kocuria marina]|nr:hypothetical protein GCM10007061_10310 [Kocuria marina]